MEKENHYPGELAYIDSFMGLIKCKVLSVNPGFPTQVTVKVTSSGRGYARGEIVTYRNDYIIPRGNIFTSCRTYKIRNNYRWINREA